VKLLGSIAPIIKAIATFLYETISPYRVIENIFGKNWCTNRKYHRVDKFVFFSFCLELLFLIPLVFLDYPFRWGLIFVIPASLLLIWRLSNILGAWLHVFIVGPGDVKSPPRTLLLVLINYFELVVIFGFAALVLKYSFYDSSVLTYQTFSSILHSLRYSVGIMTTIGSSFEPYGCVGFTLFFLEIFFGLLFIAVVIQRALSYFVPGR